MELNTLLKQTKGYVTINVFEKCALLVSFSGNAEDVLNDDDIILTYHVKTVRSGYHEVIIDVMKPVTRKKKAADTNAETATNLTEEDYNFAMGIPHTFVSDILSKVNPIIEKGEYKSYAIRYENTDAELGNTLPDSPAIFDDPDCGDVIHSGPFRGFYYGGGLLSGTSGYEVKAGDWKNNMLSVQQLYNFVTDFYGMVHGQIILIASGYSKNDSYDKMSNEVYLTDAKVICKVI